MLAESFPLNIGLLQKRVPRYNCYPTAAHFDGSVGGRHFDRWISALDPGSKVAVYLHIPFCAHLCSFCAYRTQSVSHDRQVADYLTALMRQIDRIASMLPPDCTVLRIDWGGGSPTILSVGQIETLAAKLRERLNAGPDVEFCVEVDAADTPAEKIDVLAACGMSRARIGVQDFSIKVQRAIGRQQSLKDTRRVARALRASGVSVETKILYGLPQQSSASQALTCKKALELEPENIVLSGYAHAPWIARRQRVIPTSILPGAPDRLAQYLQSAALACNAGYLPVGVDRFVQPGGPLADAVARGKLRRSILGYGSDSYAAVIGLGASAISCFPHGFTQNAMPTAGYQALVADGRSPARRGVALSREDRLRGRAIEMIMCDFKIDIHKLREEFREDIACLEPGMEAAEMSFGSLVSRGRDEFVIREHGPLLARLVARCFDARHAPASRHVAAV